MRVKGRQSHDPVSRALFEEPSAVTKLNTFPIREIAPVQRHQPNLGSYEDLPILNVKQGICQLDCED
ncbi:hypothetical protein NDU88_003075 [Pleurodeles waltl]|uniref:Uncharacterized protein n=1 Tax=Pleurodeles waltl TaxID=8319 RepID=A0AAV7MSD6_PLEWA|nr:hypothetical protein NDU88_003075 [Pleurodeles waltl]